MNEMRTAAEMAQNIADQGGGAWEIVRQLSNAADEIEFGWTGAKYPSVNVGPIEPSEEEIALIEAESIIDDVKNMIGDRKTIKTDSLKKALGYE